MNNKDSNEYFLDILKYNKGFHEPSRWIQYAKEHKFQKVKAKRLIMCPDCNSSKSRMLGQYIYYSNLMRMMVCQNCGLIYSDTILSREVLKKHFEVAYKDQQYFVNRRRQVYLQIARLIEKSACYGCEVIDIGGAQGHLLKTVRELRPDLDVTLNDLSSNACDYATSNYGIKSICCRLSELQSEKKVYDLVLLIDVLYYESKIDKAWETISNLARDSVIIRIPNKLSLIKIILLLKNVFSPREKRDMTDHIDLLNPEHSYIFSDQYIKRRLHSLGFTKTKIMPSASLMPANRRRIFLHRLLFALARIIWFISMGKIVLTPAKIVWTQKV